MTVLMVLVVNVQVRVVHHFMHVFVLMTFGEMQPNACRHTVRPPQRRLALHRERDLIR